MEKKRKREKAGVNLSNGVDIAHTLQEQNPELRPSPELPGGVPYPAWQYPPVPAAAAAPQQQQQTGLQAPPAGYWPPYGPEFRPPSFESGWPPPPSTQSGAPGSFPFPPPGVWYPYPPPYFFGCPLPTNPSAHKGFIKPPQGLSQKHQKLWELQSAENIQLWATLARVEAELASNRHRITQLELELQSLKPKTNPETTALANNNEIPPPINSTTSAAAAAAPAPLPVSTTLPQPAPVKRGRYRKPVMGNIPPEAIAPRPRGRKPSSEKFRQATKQLLATTTGPLSSFSILPEPGAGSTNGVVPSHGHQQHQPHPQQQLVVEHQTLSFDPSANKIRRDNGSGANFLNLEAIPIRSEGNINEMDNSKQVSSVVNWAPVMQVAAAAARAATGPSDEEEENEEDVVLAVANSQVRW